MLYAHIKQHLEHDLKCYVQAINGMPDHLHVLYLLNANYAVKDILKNLKGESSHWINQHDFVDSRFAWEKGYEAFSVSDSTVETVVRHIQQQKEYHKTLSFREESHQLSLMHRLEFPALTI
jgi:REP element-mobilizing transposase RayT